MKKIYFLLIVILMTLSTGLSAQYQDRPVNCGNDYNCYYEQKAQQEKIEKDAERQEEEEYRSKQLELQEQQVREIQENRLFMEQQMQTQEADKYEKLLEE